MAIEFICSEYIATALATLGRTEDIKFSPDFRTLAIAGFARDRCLLLHLNYKTSGENTQITASGLCDVSSHTLKRPHGLAFIDNDMLLIANRSGNVSLFRVPSHAGRNKSFVLSPVQVINSIHSHLVDSPGSVSATILQDGIVEVLVCNNYVNRVTRHVLDPLNEYLVCSDEVLLEKYMNLPDGVVVSHNDRWIAISNHLEHTVLIFDRESGIEPGAAPDAILHGVSYPHGLVFTRDDDLLLVADAGRPYVYVYRSTSGSWSGETEPCARYRVMQQDRFTRGHVSPKEGGPKGIDIHDNLKILATTCEHQPLEFHDLSSVLEGARCVN